MPKRLTVHGHWLSGGMKASRQPPHGRTQHAPASPARVQAPCAASLLARHARDTPSLEQMSKSLGNIVDPHEIIDTFVTPFPHCIFVTLCHALPPLYFCNTLCMFGLDTVRYFLIKEGAAPPSTPRHRKTRNPKPLDTAPLTYYSLQPLNPYRAHQAANPSLPRRQHPNRRRLHSRQAEGHLCC